MCIRVIEWCLSYWIWRHWHEKLESIEKVKFLYTTHSSVVEAAAAASAASNFSRKKHAHYKHFSEADYLSSNGVSLKLIHHSLSAALTYTQIAARLKWPLFVIFRHMSINPLHVSVCVQCGCWYLFCGFCSCCFLTIPNRCIPDQNACHINGTVVKRTGEKRPRRKQCVSRVLLNDVWHHVVIYSSRGGW